MPLDERAFDFLHLTDRPAEPRDRGITESRGPYDDPMEPRALRDSPETMGHYVGSDEFSGGSFALLPESAVRELVESSPEFDLQVSTGGTVEYMRSGLWGKKSSGGRVASSSRG